MMCSKGCGRPAKVRGMCKSHYTSERKRQEILGQWKPRTNPIGTTRRLQALVALGYSQRHLADLLSSHQSWVSKLLDNERNHVNAGTAQRIADLYNRISMTPGPCDRARRAAQIKGWAPPLAWDEDAIDDPRAQADTSRPRKWIPFSERYAEMRDLGYNDLQIIRRWNIKPESLLRQLNRYEIEPSADLVKLATSLKYERAKTAS